MHTAVTLAFLFCLVAAYASALPAEPLNNDNVKEVAPVAAIEDQEVLQGAEARWRHDDYHKYHNKHPYNRDRYNRYHDRYHRHG